MDAIKSVVTHLAVLNQIKVLGVERSVAVANVRTNVSYTNGDRLELPK